MLMDILGAVLGTVVASIVVAIVEAIGHKIFPPPEGVNFKDPEKVKEIMHLIPFPAKLAVLIAWGAGVFVGGSLAIWIAGGTIWPAYVVAGLMLAAGFATMAKIPHPSWMVIGAVVVTVLAGWGAGQVMV